MLLSALALHGEVGAADEIALVVLGLLMVGVFVLVVVRSRKFKPELEEPGSDAGFGESQAPRDYDD